jgi:filamentous hemagglutinin
MVTEIFAGFTPAGIAVDIKDLLQANTMQDRSLAVLGIVLPGLGDGVKAVFKGTDLVTLPGMSRPIRPINPDFLPNQAVVDAINSPQIQAWTKDADCFDCSEIAGRLLLAAGGKGQIVEVRPTVRGNLNVFENGKMEASQSYHQVYTDGRYVYDPRLSNQPIPKGDWEQHIRNINPGGINISQYIRGLQ